MESRKTLEASWRELYSNSPGIPDGHQGDITVWAKLQYTVLWLDSYSKELNILRCICTHTCVILEKGGGHMSPNCFKK